jgi:glutamine synthetase adenylyltransferase
MAKTGSINNLFVKAATNWKAYNLLQTSSEKAYYDKTLSATLNALKKINQEKNIESLLQAEGFMLTQELSLYANSKEETDSISAALIQLQDARKSLDVVEKPRSYQAATKTYGTKDKENELPLDSFRKFL